MKIRMDEVMDARMGIASILAFEHHKTRNGVRSGPMLKLMKLNRALREYEEVFQEAIKALIVKYGEEKVEGQPSTAFISKDSPNRFIYAEERNQLLRAEVEIDDSFCVTVEELNIRDENGELVEMENGKIGLLGPLLVEKM